MWAALAMLALGAIALSYVLFAAASKPASTAGLMQFAVGHMDALVVLDDPPPLPTRLVRDVEGREVSLSSFTGEQVMVLNIWATSCAPCTAEMPSLAALQARYEGRLRVIPVSIDSEAERERAVRRLAELGHGRLPFLIDISRGVIFDLGSAGLPVTVIYDRHGRELARLAGGADWSSEEANALIDAVLGRESGSRS